MTPVLLFGSSARHHGHPCEESLNLPRAGSVEQHAVESAQGLRELAGVEVGNDDVAAAHSVDVTDQTLCTLLV